MNRCLAVELLESRRLLTFVAVDFHNHYFAHYGAGGTPWQNNLPAANRASHLSTILAGANLNTTIPEFVSFSEHAGWKTYNQPSAVKDLESKLATALANRPANAASYGASVGIELSPNDTKNPHFGVPFVDANSLSSTYYNSSTDFGLDKLVTIANLPNQQGLMVWNHPAATALNTSGGLTRTTMQQFLNFMTNTYGSNFRTSAVRTSFAAIEFPKYFDTTATNLVDTTNFTDRFRFTERLMVAATIDGFRLTPTIGSDSHTEFNPLRLTTPFVAEMPTIRNGIGILDTPTPVSGLVSESSVRDALAARRGAAVYQRDATISVNGNLGSSIVREGASVASLPTTLTVNVERFPPSLINRVEARYVIRENFTSTSFLNATFENKIVSHAATANATKTSFTFSTTNRGNVALIYFVALDNQNVPVAITAPIFATGSSAATSPVTVLSQTPVNTNRFAPAILESPNASTSSARDRFGLVVQSPIPATTSLQLARQSPAILSPSRSPSVATREFDLIDSFFTELGASGILGLPLN